MMKSNFLATATLICAAVFTSCNVNDDIEDGDQPQAVRFTASIDSQATTTAPNGTRAAGTTWGNDAIGVFMVSHNTTAIVENASNKQYTTPGSGAFTAVSGDEIYYPMDGSSVDFIAYYPWTTGRALGTDIDVVIGAQTNQAAFDLLWSNNATGFSKTSGNVALAFDHKLAKIVMNVKADASVGVALTNMAVTIKGMNTKNTFDLANGKLGTADTEADITPAKITTADTFDASYDAIIMPGSYAAGDVTVAFAVGSDTFTWTLTAAQADFVGGNEYTYEVTLTRTGVQVTGTINPWISNPMGGVTAE